MNLAPRFTPNSPNEVIFESNYYFFKKMNTAIEFLTQKFVWVENFNFLLHCTLTFWIPSPPPPPYFTHSTMTSL